MPFQNHIFPLKKISIKKENGLEINLPAFYPDILMYSYIVILLVYQTFGTFPMRELVIGTE